MYYILLLYLLLYSIFIYVHFLCSVLPSIVLYMYMYVCKPFAHTQLCSHLIDFHSAISIPQDVVCKDDQSEPLCICLATIILFYLNDL